MTDNTEPTIDEPNKLQELFDNYHIVKYGNIDAIQALIRTEKLKLLAEVRERVVGENEVSKARTDKLRQSPPWQRNQLRNDQRTELAKLEAEL